MHNIVLMNNQLLMLLVLSVLTITLVNNPLFQYATGILLIFWYIGLTRWMWLIPVDDDGTILSSTPALCIPFFARIYRVKKVCMWSFSNMVSCATSWMVYQIPISRHCRCLVPLRSWNLVPGRWSTQKSPCPPLEIVGRLQWILQRWYAVGRSAVGRSWACLYSLLVDLFPCFLVRWWWCCCCIISPCFFLLLSLAALLLLLLIFCGWVPLTVVVIPGDWCFFVPPASLEHHPRSLLSFFLTFFATVAAVLRSAKLTA